MKAFGKLQAMQYNGELFACYRVVWTVHTVAYSVYQPVCRSPYDRVSVPCAGGYVGELVRIAAHIGRTRVTVQYSDEHSAVERAVRGESVFTDTVH